ncbi:MAG: hypothetical protein JW768_04720 [Chitinispirillaceae bacterium]|nr:hypothetical protein [Chitinispirillaceae bacterium]
MKERVNIHLLVCLIIGLAWSTGHAQEFSPRLDVSGTVALEHGQILRSHLTQIPIDIRQWLHRDLIRVRVQAAINDRLLIVAQPEIKLWFNTFPKANSIANVPFRQYSFVSILEGKGTYSFFGNDDPALRLSVGMFPLKYASDAVNLGEYLFRSGAYPSYVFTSFDYPYARLYGIHLSNSLLDIVQQDLLLHSEVEIQPLHDWSLSYLANVSIKRFAELGGGISLHRWFSVTEQLTTPKYDSRQNAYYTADGSTDYYTFRGIKLMGSAAFDPKAFLPAGVRETFGKKDLRLYGEAAVLGVKDYPAYISSINGSDTAWIRDTVNDFYGSIMERIPVMAGFTFPTCNLFDHVSLEIESYGWRYSNSYYSQQFYSENAKPVVAKKSYSAADYNYDRWKWSLNFKKSLTRGFAVTGQFARDHLHHENYVEGDRDEEEALTRSYDWYWMARVQYNF